MLVVCCLGLEWLLLGFDRNFPYHGSENDLVFEKPRDWGVVMDNHDQSRIGWLVGKNDGRRGEGRGGSGDPAGDNGEILNLLEPRASY